MEISDMQSWVHGGDHGDHMSRLYHRSAAVSKSGPDIRLTELEQQLEVAETRCGSLKSQLDYMKMLYQGVHPEPNDQKELIEQPMTQQGPIVRTPSVKPSSVIVNDTIEEGILEDKKYYNFLKGAQKMQETTQENIESMKKTPRSSARSPRDLPVIDKICNASMDKIVDSNAEYRHVRQTKIKNRMAASIEHEAIKEFDIDDATALQHPYQRHLIEYSKGLEDDMGNAKDLPSFEDDREQVIGKLQSPLPKKEKKNELTLRLSGSNDSAQPVRRKKAVKPEKKKRFTPYSTPNNNKPSTGKADDSVSVTSKIRRKRGRLRSTNSKSTIATKDTNLSERRDLKKRKQKGVRAIPCSQSSDQHRATATRSQQNWREVVEIYHNNAVGSGTISMASSKHSKPEVQAEEANGEENLSENNQRPVKELIIKTQPQEHISHRLQCQEEIERNNVEIYHAPRRRDVERPVEQNYDANDCNAHRQPEYRSSLNPSSYFDPTVIRNYELPTVASKLKQVNRSYFQRFNFRNIPFVVGTSISPSHNLGLNIQQVLSIMKTKQPALNGFTPLIIHKVSKGMEPVSTLLEQMNNQCHKLPGGGQFDFTDRSFEKYDSYNKLITTKKEASSSGFTAYLPTQTSRLTNRPDIQFYCNTRQESNEKGHELLYKKEEEPFDKQSGQLTQSRCTCCTKQTMSNNRILKFTSRRSIFGNPKLTQSALLRQRKEELNEEDGYSTNNQNTMNNSKGIREVLINLHDQFEEMNTRYEKLQEQVQKSDDKALRKEIQAIEKELNAKEEEINAVVGLYKEVLALKQQMKMLHERNSLVCIAAESPPTAFIRNPHIPTRAHTANPMQINGKRRGFLGMPNCVYQNSTSTCLAGLLRQIQTFQKQLSS